MLQSTHIVLSEYPDPNGSGVRRGIIESAGFVSQANATAQNPAKGFQIRFDGNAEFNNATFRGHIEATSGTFRGTLEARYINVTGTHAPGNNYVIARNNAEISPAYDSSGSINFFATKTLRISGTGSCYIVIRANYGAEILISAGNSPAFYIDLTTMGRNLEMQH